MGHRKKAGKRLLVLAAVLVVFSSVVTVNAGENDTQIPDGVEEQKSGYDFEDYEKQYNAAFTEEEKAYIREQGVIKVALETDVPLICEYDAATKQYHGIAVDVLDKMAQDTGLKFVYTSRPQEIGIHDYMENNPDVLIAPFYKNSIVHYGNGMIILNSIVRSRMMSIGREDNPQNWEESFILALPEEMCQSVDKIYELFPRVQVVPCKSHEDGMKMVRDGWADMTLVNEISGSYMLQSPYYHELIVTHIESLVEDITFALGTASNPTLVSILNKEIDSLSERDVREIVLNNTVSHGYKMSVREWLYENGLLFSVCILTFGGFLAVVFVGRKRERERKQQLLLEAERRRADEEYKQKLFRQANFDELTGLYNRKYFIQKATELLEKNPDTVYSLFRINIENFKMVNEIYGIKYGDIVLQKVSEKLKRLVGKKGVCGRVYADHFVACYPVAEARLRRIGDVPPVLVECNGQNIRVQIDVGVYVNTKRITDVRQFWNLAQIALREKKRSESNAHLYFYEERFMTRLLKNQKITDEMEQALREGQFHVFLQPQFDQLENTLVGAEALVRWFHPKEGIIPPNEFIPVFEGNRFIYQLDAYICEEVCRLLAKWKMNGRLVPVSINVSRMNVENPLFLPTLLDIVEKYKIPPKYLHVEITESAYMENRNELLELLFNLKEHGFIVEMDDFGSGYSSFNALKDLPVDVLKLDMEFFSGETHMDKGGKIIETIVEMSHAVGITVIAEGVETEREANFLKLLHCHIVQGYLYGRPVAVEEFEQLLAEREIGEKMSGHMLQSAEMNLYWNLEKYNVLLQNTKAILLEYDPENDCAVFTYMGEDGLAEKVVEHYAENIMESKRLHPEDRECVRDILLDKSTTEHIEFQADYYEEGKYEPYYGTIYSYHKKNTFSRLIAVIKKSFEN